MLVPIAILPIDHENRKQWPRAIFLAYWQASGLFMFFVQVKVLLENKKFEILVDDDLNDNYIEDEVESLFQIALVCTQSDPIKRPKMSEVVKMLDGDGGLAERWEWKKLESAFNLHTTIGKIATIGPST